jgi:N-acetylmuramic acid 6-phosphate etherase
MTKQEPPEGLIDMTQAKENLASLETEASNERTAELDTLSTHDLIRTLHAENYTVADAVGASLPEIVKLVDVAAERLANGGRLFYVGAGTSGRIGVLDASECPPTFGVEKEMVQGVIAGGRDAVTTSLEGVEDKKESGGRDLGARRVGAQDVVIGIAASGRTPYVIGAMEAARKVGAYTAAVVNVPSSQMSYHADITIIAATGPEALAGSTRLKAGTAQKMILNLISTGVMVRLGKVYRNLMVDVRATNEKLKDRATRIVMVAAEVDYAKAQQALQQADWSAKVAIVMLKLGLDADRATERLFGVNDNLRLALGSE